MLLDYLHTARRSICKRVGLVNICSVQRSNNINSNRSSISSNILGERLKVGSGGCDRHGSRAMSTASSSKDLTIDIYSDVICPWCYIGTRRLEKALATFDQPINVKIQYHPFELDATLPTQSMDKKQYLLRRFGPERIVQMSAYLNQVGKSVGIDFADGKIGNTLMAHQAFAFVQKTNPEVAKPYMLALFKASFEENKDITSVATLAECAEPFGITRSDLEEALGNEENLKAVRAEIEKAKQKGIHGVPYFIINNSVVVEGAEEPMVLKNAFRKALA